MGVEVVGREALTLTPIDGGANAVTSFSCCNSTLSHLVVSAASDRTVHVLDAKVLEECVKGVARAMPPVVRPTERLSPTRTPGTL